MRLIDADKLDTRERGNNSQRTMWHEIERLINSAPTVDAIVSPVSIGQTVYEIDFRKQIRERRVSMITQKANGEFKARLSSRGCYSSDYTEDELERYVFLTRDAAEAALKAREQNA